MECWSISLGSTRVFSHRVYENLGKSKHLGGGETEMRGRHLPANLNTIVEQFQKISMTTARSVT